MSLVLKIFNLKIKACLFLFRFWSEHWNLTVLMRNRLLSTPLQHMICTSMTGNTQKPHQHHRPGKETGPYICVHKNLKTWRCNFYNIWWLLLRIWHNYCALISLSLCLSEKHKKFTTKLLEMFFGSNKKELMHKLGSLNVCWDIPL